MEHSCKCCEELMRLAGCVFPTSSEVAVVEIDGKMHATSPAIAKEISSLRTMLKIAESFHKVAVKERDAARLGF